MEVSTTDPPERVATSLGGADPFNALLAMMANDRADEAVSSRARQRWLRTQADEEARFSGVLLDLAERHGLVALRTSDGRQRRARIRGIGADFVALESSDGQRSLLRLDAVIAVTGTGDHDLPSGDRSITSTIDLVTALAGLVMDRTDVVLRPGAGEPLSGELRSVGFDVARLRTESPAQTVAVNLASIAEVVLL